MNVTFLGHKNAPIAKIKNKAYASLVELIEKDGANQFYVGNQGSFDLMVYDILKELKIQYPRIQYNVVFAYFPEESERGRIDEEHTIYPEGFETVPRKFAIDRRNHWMIEQSDIVVTFVERPFGGAAKFKEIARRKKKRVIELSE
ncbi:MAG: DUF1273 family protein [Clostridia bacterium]|nr:DUF1273 family protein [Clostridia bacterium]